MIAVSLRYYVLRLRGIINTFIGIKPSQAIAFLREMTTTPLQLYDIYNLYASFKREQRGGLSANGALIQHLKDHKIHVEIKITEVKQTQTFFIEERKGEENNRLQGEVDANIQR